MALPIRYLCGVAIVIVIVSKSVISNMEDLIVATMAIAMVICTYADYHITLLL